MTSRVMIFDKHQHYLTDLDYSTNRTWKLNDVSKCDISVATTDSKCLLKYLEYGNLIHVQHVPSQNTDGTYNGKLPDWTGIILRGRGWDDGILHFTPYSSESIMMIRPMMPHEEVKGTPKHIFTTIIKKVAALNTNINIQLGTVEDDGKQYSDRLTGSAYEHLANLQKLSNMSWDISSEIDKNGNLVLKANLYFKTGVDTGIELNELNQTKGKKLLEEVGTPMNVINGFSQSNTDRQRYTGQGIHTKALGKFGYFGVNQTFMGLRDPSSVREASQTMADIFGEPVMQTSRSALDVGKTFDYIRKGNTVTVTDHRVGFNPNGGFGFSKRGRILHMDYNEVSNPKEVALKLELV